MGFDSLLVMSMALAPGLLAVGLWQLATESDLELQDCAAHLLQYPVAEHFRFES